MKRRQAEDSSERKGDDVEGESSEDIRAPGTDTLHRQQRTSQQGEQRRERRSEYLRRVSESQSGGEQRTFTSGGDGQSDKDSARPETAIYSGAGALSRPSSIPAQATPPLPSSSREGDVRVSPSSQPAFDARGRREPLQETPSEHNAPEARRGQQRTSLAHPSQQHQLQYGSLLSALPMLATPSSAREPLAVSERRSSSAITGEQTAGAAPPSDDSKAAYIRERNRLRMARWRKRMREKNPNRLRGQQRRKDVEKFEKDAAGRSDDGDDDNVPASTPVESATAYVSPAQQPAGAGRSGSRIARSFRSAISGSVSARFKPEPLLSTRGGSGAVSRSGTGDLSAGLSLLPPPFLRLADPQVAVSRPPLNPEGTSLAAPSSPSPPGTPKRFLPEREPSLTKLFQLQSEANRSTSAAERTAEDAAAGHAAMGQYGVARPGGYGGGFPLGVGALQEEHRGYALPQMPERQRPGDAAGSGFGAAAGVEVGRSSAPQGAAGSEVEGQSRKDNSAARGQEARATPIERRPEKLPKRSTDDLTLSMLNTLRTDLEEERRERGLLMQQLIHMSERIAGDVSELRLRIDRALALLQRTQSHDQQHQPSDDE